MRTNAILHPAHDSARQHFCTFNEPEVDALAATVHAALVSEDWEAEHAALRLVAEYLGIDGDI